MSDVSECWLPVLGFEGYYEVSDLGRVRSLDRYVAGPGSTRRRIRGRVLKPKAPTRSMPYQCVELCRDSIKKHFCVHRVVCEAFYGLRPPGAVCRHLNGNHLDNRLENLVWGTCAENTADMIRHGNAYWANQTHCIHGHEFTEANTRRLRFPNGGQHRNCRECERIRAIPKNARRDQRAREQRPTHSCRVCSATFQSSQRGAAFCSAECKRISRRKAFGWKPKHQREEAA